MTGIETRRLREFKGDGVWRDQDGKMWTPFSNVVTAVTEARSFWLEQLPGRDEIAALAAEHVQCIDWWAQQRENGCSCGWEGEPDEFDHHFADAVLAPIQNRYQD